ncbi:MAG: SoxR reducing system RseC family protein [Oscillospiraceae bacterium]|nr:SoxR reducing system RseC family protein [Oscillospiraceae bacterium]
MTQIATVETLLQDGRAEITVARKTACAHDCSECAGCGATPSPVRAVAVNAVGAVKGQKVVVESESKQVIGAALLVYILPFVLFFITYFACSGLLSDVVRSLAAILAFMAGVAVAIFADRRLKRNGGMVFTIVRVI